MLLLTPVLADEYSYERAEELTPLIEWRQYGPDAFQESIDKNKPIFLLLTAPSWCYWCQVYESTDYLFHPDVVSVINQDFIPIYVDADKRQDLTRQYLEGGWPSTTVMTPGRERLFGYSGVRPVEVMIENLDNAAEHVKLQTYSTQIGYSYQAEEMVIPTEEELSQMIAGYSAYNARLFDSEFGGFGNGQKFPQPRALDYALTRYEKTGNDIWLQMVETTLEHQYTEISELETNYNLFDPVEGGFHRYGTARDWTPPHYEKMLYDNARLLRLYYHLLQLKPDNAIAKEVVGKTEVFIENNWYEAEGGFYGNSDVHGEDGYYGKYPRPDDKPRVETTKYTDWNSEAILTYLYMYEDSSDEKYKEMSQRSLDFFISRIDENGAHHYYSDTTGVQGSLVDNAYLLLASVEGYEVLSDEKYLDAAISLADYSLENLYDWNSGGFFERNSEDTGYYAPGENTRLNKPAENGLMAYGLLKLYNQTKDEKYLSAAVLTLGNRINGISGLDSGYYYILAAEMVVVEDWLTDFEPVDGPDRFWLDNLLEPEFEITVEEPNTSFVVLLVLALIAGLLSLLSPCTLPVVPAFFAYAFGSKNVIGKTAAFFLGLSTLFVLLGIGANLIGGFLKQNLLIFTQVSGALILLFGLYILAGQGFSGLRLKTNKPTSLIGTFLFGIVFGASWTPCVGPILVAVLIMASTAGSAISGGVLLFAYTVGFAVPFIVFAVFAGSRIEKLLSGKELRFRLMSKRMTVHTTTLISGLLFIILGVLILSGQLTALNRLGSTIFQTKLYAIEEHLVEFFR